MTKLDPYNIFHHQINTLGDKNAVAIKANIAVANLPCSGGIKAYAQDIAPKNARVVMRLLEAGYDIAGIVNMEEGALGAQTDNPWFGKTHNPLKYGYTAGGSSGGSAAAVAAGYCDLALGTDTMGSVRIPSAYCGLWGFKPSYDAKMLEGVMPLSHSLDTVGVHGKDFSRVTELCETISGRKYSGGIAGQIHVLDFAGTVEIDHDILVCFENVVKTIDGNIEKTCPRTQLTPYQFASSRRAGLIISEAEGYAYHAPRMAKDPDGFSPIFRQMLEYGRDLSQDKIDTAYAHIEDLRRADFPDFILMPTAPQTAFAFGEPVPANQADFTAFANLADRPAIQFPIGFSQSGLPIGAQLIGPRGGEADLVETMHGLWQQINQI